MMNLTKDELERLYIEEDLSINQIAKQIGRTYNYVKKRVEKYELSKSKVYMDKEWLHNKYIMENLTTTQIAELCGVTDPTIATALRVFGIKKDHEVLQKTRMEKVVQTNLERFNTEHAFQSEAVKEKIKKSMIDRHGVDNPMKSKKIREKTYKTNLKRFGVKHPAQSKKINFKAMKTKEKSGMVKFVDGDDTINSICVRYRVPPLNVYRLFATPEEVSLDKVYEYVNKYVADRKSPLSRLEIFFSENFNVKFYNKMFDSELYPKLKYKPDFKINNKTAVNVDGIYWHSESSQKNNNYHFDLRKSFEDFGLRIFQFRENEVFQKTDIVRSILNNYLGNSKNISASEATLVPLNVSSAQLFFEANNLSGFSDGEFFGLILNDELVMAVSYSIYPDKINIERLCSKNNTFVADGVSNIISNIRKNYPGLPIHYRIDLRYETGDFLEKLGFKKSEDIIDFDWTNHNDTFNRLRCRANMDDRNLSQEEYAKELGWVKIWDAGQRLWVLNP